MDGRLFVGFGSLEDLVEDLLVDECREVRASTLLLPMTRETAGLRLSQGGVMVAAAVADSVRPSEVRYAWVVVGYMQRVGGRVLRGEDVPARMMVAYHGVCAWLAVQGFEVRDGVYGMPQDARLMEARAGCLDREEDTGDGEAGWPGFDAARAN